MKEAIMDGYILNPIKGIVPFQQKCSLKLRITNSKVLRANGSGYEEIPDNTDTGIGEEG